MGEGVVNERNDGIGRSGRSKIERGSGDPGYSRSGDRRYISEIGATVWPLPGLARTDVVLANLVEQGLVADVELGGRALAVPRRLFLNLRNHFHLSAVLQIANHFLQVGLLLRLSLFRRDSSAVLRILMHGLLQFVDRHCLVAKD